MKINKYILSALTIAIVAQFAASCGDDDDRNTAAEAIVEFEAAPSFSESFSVNNSVTLITENAVRYHVANIIDGIFTVTMIETATDLIFIDVGPDSAFVPIPELDEVGLELRTYANAIGKPLSIIMTHEHFDHWGAMASFQDVPVYAHSDVAPLLMASEGFTSRYGSSNVNAVSSSLELGGLTFNFDTIQNAETGENSYIYIESLQAVFVADLVYNRAHNYIREYTPLDGTDEIQNWLDGLAVLNEKFGAYAHIFCGHGGTTTDIPVVIGLNEDYLKIARDLISGNQLLTQGDTEGEKASTSTEVVNELLFLYPLGEPTFYKVSGSGFALPDALFPGDPGAIWFE